VIGVAVGVDGIFQRQAKIIDEFKVAIDLLEHRINEHRLTAVSEEVSVRA